MSSPRPVSGADGTSFSPAPQSVSGGDGNSISPAPQSVSGGDGNSISPAPQSISGGHRTSSISPAPQSISGGHRTSSISPAPQSISGGHRTSSISPAPQSISGGDGTSPPPNSGGSYGGGSSSSGVGTPVIGGVVGGIIGVLVIVAIVWVLLARKKPKWRLGSCFGLFPSYTSTKKDFQGKDIRIAVSGEEPGSKSVSKHPEVSKAFTYQELEQATSGFSPSNLLGEGGFGRVYKATIAGNLVAVKQLKLGSGQGDREFQAEVEIISRVHHRHLVSLVGYCISQIDRLLVYKYVPNGTLEHALHSPGQPCMDWATRMNIALGTARGLAYLHEDCHPRIIHRDIKGSNILLDDQWEAQVADFGLAKLADDAQTHVTTRVMGTFGYLAPEYAMSGKLTDKSDVFSFGVVLLELITGKKPVDKTLQAADGQESLVEWARPLLTEALETGNVDALVDRNLNYEYDEEEMFRMVDVAATCVRHSFQKRPKMVEALHSLASHDGDLHQGALPGHSKEQTGEDLNKFRQLAFEQ